MSRQIHSILNTVREADQEIVEAGGWTCNTNQQCHSLYCRGSMGLGVRIRVLSLRLATLAYESVAWRSGWSATLADHHYTLVS